MRSRDDFYVAPPRYNREHMRYYDEGADYDYQMPMRRGRGEMRGAYRGAPYPPPYNYGHPGYEQRGYPGERDRYYNDQPHDGYGRGGYMMPPRERPPYERGRGYGPRIARGGHEMEESYRGPKQHKPA